LCSCVALTSINGLKRLCVVVWL